MLFAFLTWTIRLSRQSGFAHVTRQLSLIRIVTLFSTQTYCTTTIDNILRPRRHWRRIKKKKTSRKRRRKRRKKRRIHNTTTTPPPLLLDNTPKMGLLPVAHLVLHHFDINLLLFFHLLSLLFLAWPPPPLVDSRPLHFPRHHHRLPKAFSHLPILLRRLRRNTFRRNSWPRHLLLDRRNRPVRKYRTVNNARRTTLLTSPSYPVCIDACYKYSGRFGRKSTPSRMVSS